MSISGIKVTVLILISITDPNRDFETTIHRNVQRENITLMDQFPVSGNLTTDFEHVGISHERFYEIRCFAPYPIEFTYEGQGTPQVKTSSFRKLIGGTKLEDFRNPSNYKFEIRLELKPREGNTGNYVCKSLLVADKEYQRNYVYLFIPGPELFIAGKPETLGIFGHGPSAALNFNGKNSPNKLSLLETKKTGHLILGSSLPGSLLLIPCAISDPRDNILIRLYEKVMNKGQKLELQDITQTAEFDPMRGFSIQPPNSSITAREFECRAFETSGNRTDKIVHLNQSVSFILAPNFENTTRTIEYSKVESNHIFRCDVFPKTGKIFFGRQDCYSPMDCRFLETRLKNGYLPRIMTNSKGSFSLAYMTLFTQLPDSRVDMDGQRTGSILPVSGIFYCSSGRNQMTSLVYNSFWHSVFTNLTQKPTVDDLLQILLVHPDYEDDSNKTTISFICIGRSYFYSHGFIWLVETENGTMEYFNGEKKTSHSAFIKTKLVLNIQYYNNIGSNSEDLYKNTSIKRIACLAPILQSSSQWDKVSLSIEEAFEGLNNEDELDYDFYKNNAELSVQRNAVFMHLLIFGRMFLASS